MNINTINTLKAQELNGQKKGKLKIAGCEAVAQSYGIYIYGPKHVEVFFNYNLNKWVIGILSSPDDTHKHLSKNASKQDFINTITGFMTGE